jgi:hypothetical protein
MKSFAQILLGAVLLASGLFLVVVHPDDDVLWWTGLPLGVLVGALGVVYAGSALWQRVRRR